MLRASESELVEDLNWRGNELIDWADLVTGPRVIGIIEIDSLEINPPWGSDSPRDVSINFRSKARSICTLHKYTKKSVRIGAVPCLATHVHPPGNVQNETHWSNDRFDWVSEKSIGMQPYDPPLSSPSFTKRESIMYKTRGRTSHSPQRSRNSVRTLFGPFQSFPVTEKFITLHLQSLLLLITWGVSFTKLNLASIANQLLCNVR